MVLPTVLALQTRYFQPILFYGITSYVVIYLLTIGKSILSLVYCRSSCCAVSWVMGGDVAFVSHTLDDVLYHSPLHTYLYFFLTFSSTKWHPFAVLVALSFSECRARLWYSKPT
jgi:hypothetical protein